MFFKRILTVCFLFFTLNALSQTPDNEPKSIEITGLIIDSVSKLPIEYSTISLFEEGAEKPVSGSISNGQGKFKLNVSKSGYYNILVESIEYNSYPVHHIVIEKGSIKNLGRILLVKKITSLQAVTVTQSQKLIENKIDKMVFNAEKDLTSQGGVATDILKKIPQVSVDVDGNVELAGSTSIRFLIDGKPSTAFGSNITDVLQSIPASQIKSVEVITNPGAKYDAEGLGGIINIILKHNMVKGINGNLSLTAASRNENASLNLNARNGNIGVNLYVNGNYRVPVTTQTVSNRLSQDTLSKSNVNFEQDGDSKYKRFGIESGFSIDYTPWKKNNFNFSFSTNSFGSNNDGYLNQIQTTSDYGGNPLSELLTLSQTQNSFRIRENNASLDYKKTFDREDQELDIGIHSSFGNSHYGSVNNQSTVPGDSLFYGTNNDNPGKEVETEFIIDYTQPLGKKMIWGSGGKMNFRDIHSTSNVLSLQPESGDYLYDSTLSNFLHYQQAVYALYTELSFPVATWFDAKMGLRYERTEINTYFSNVSQQVPEPGYNTFVPSVFLSRKLNDQQTIRVSYSKRISRPDYRDLNPFVNTTDPNNFVAGNPYLKPEIGNRSELGWNYDLNGGGSFMISAFYRTSQDDIQPYIVYYASLPVGDTTYTNVAVSTKENIGLEKNLGMNLFSDLHFGTKFSVRTNIFFFHREIVNALDSGQDAHSWNYRINMNLTYNLTPTFASEFFANFNSPRNELQGKYPSFSSYTFAFRKQIWNKKGSLALTATNIFSEYLDQTTTLYGQGFVINSTRKIPFRSIGINFTWKFGKLEFKKPKPENGDAAPASEL